MSRYAPTLDLWSGSHNLTADCLDLTIDMTITHKSPSIDFTLDNRKERWSNTIELGLIYVPITCAVNGVDFFKGRLDTTTKDISKRGGNILVCSGRGDFGALEDITSSLQFVNAYPYDIVNTIIAEYNLRKGTNDPTITTLRNDAPQQGGSNAIKMSFQWKRMSLQRMLFNLQQALGAPYANGGVSTYYDFYLDTSDGFYFDETGNYASGVTIPANSETMTAKRICDMNPYRSDVWLWCDASAGRIPLTMQPSYNTYHFSPPHTPDPQDLWTENNVSDFHAGDASPTLSASSDNAQTSSVYSIEADFGQVYPNAAGYFYMPFPFGSGGSKWPGQWPNALLNCYNEVPFVDSSKVPNGSAMSETMGEMTGLTYYLKVLLGSNSYVIHYIQVQDINGYTMNSCATGVGAAPDGLTINDNDVWHQVTTKFGPSAGYYEDALYPTLPVDWSSINQIRFMFYPQDDMTGFTVRLDCLAITKPLVVSASDPGPGLRKTDIQQQTTIAAYLPAAQVAYGLLQNENKPQIYWDFQNLGRTDIEVGRTFGVDSLNLLMRELKLTMSKRRGFLITGKAYESV